MSQVYIVGDVQGCYHTFLRLYAQIPKHAKIYFAGDVLNRGKHSLEMLRWIYRHQDQCEMVLGNHDVHAIAVLLGVRQMGYLDTLESLRSAPDRHELVRFLCKQPLIIRLSNIRIAHAGIHPLVSFSIQDALAQEFSSCLQDKHPHLFLREMFGYQPTLWHPLLGFNDKMRFILNICTRMRYIHEKTGELDLKHKNLHAPTGFEPWFNVYQKHHKKTMAIFGHWSHKGLINYDKTIGLDTGCVWGGFLTSVVINPKHPKKHSFLQQANIETTHDFKVSIS